MEHNFSLSIKSSMLYTSKILNLFNIQNILCFQILMSFIKQNIISDKFELMLKYFLFFCPWWCVSAFKSICNTIFMFKISLKILGRPLFWRLYKSCSANYLKLSCHIPFYKAALCVQPKNFTLIFGFLTGIFRSNYFSC